MIILVNLNVTVITKNKLKSSYMLFIRDTAKIWH